MSSEKILSYAAKRGAGGGPLSPAGDFVSCQPMHAFFFFSSQVQRHVEVVRPALAVSITTDGGSQNGDEGFTAVSITWPGFHGRTLETEALPSHHQ